MRKTTMSWAVLALLSACGGGGGDGGGTAPVAPAAEPLQISSANYQTVATEAVSSGSYLVDATSLVTGAQLTTRPALFAAAWSEFARLPGLFASASHQVTGATVTDTMPCSGGGRVDATLNDANGNQMLDAGESATLVAVDCVEADTTINGTLGFDVRSLSGDLNGTVYTASVGITLSSFSVASGAGNASGSGTMAIDISSTGVNARTLSLSVNALTVTGSFGGISDSVSMSNYVLSQTVTPQGSGYLSSNSVSGHVASTALGGKSVVLSTISPLAQYSSDAYPASGQLLATGLNNSKVRLTAQNASQALLELDGDGDGSYETSVVRAWSTLL